MTCYHGVAEETPVINCWKKYLAYSFIHPIEKVECQIEILVPFLLLVHQNPINIPKFRFQAKIVKEKIGFKKVKIKSYQSTGREKKLGFL